MRECDGALMSVGDDASRCHGVPARPGRGRWTILIGLSALLGGCELDEVALTAPEDLLVAEVYLRVGEEGSEVVAFLHSTLGTGKGQTVPGARVLLTLPAGDRVTLDAVDPAICLEESTIEDVEGSCYAASGSALATLTSGDLVTTEIFAPDGRRLDGATTIPGAFALYTPGVSDSCSIPPGQSLEIVWSPSDGAWLYSAETLIWDLPEALAAQGIEVEEDPLYLLGVSVSEEDTTVVFPTEFGVFERFDLDRDLALALSEGLPAGTSADVTIGALDRNYVNWVRGGTFNPSGLVRVPSLRGDGTGVFGSVVRRSFRVVTAPASQQVPLCGGS